MRRSLVSLAVVTALWDQRKSDYLENFVPFIATLLEARNHRYIERDEIHSLCNQFEEEFGLRLPFHPMTAVLNRCVRRRLLRRLERGYAVDVAACTKLNLSQERDSYVRKQRDLVSQFAAYAKETFGESIAIEDAEMAMLEFLARFDMEVVISNRGSKSALPERPKGKRNRRLIYMLSRFTIDAHKENPQSFRTFCDIALGHMIAGAVLLDGYDWPSDTVRGSNVYLDSPIILRLIGTAGESQAEAFTEFVSDLRTKGARLWVFEHSKTEAMQILDGARFWVGRPDFNPALASRAALFFRQQGYTESEIERFFLRVDDVLRRHQIEIFDEHPYMDNRKFQVDEALVKRAVEEYYGKSDPGFDAETHEDRTLRDVASLAAVYRLRAGRSSTLLRETKHVFVSTNATLSRASRAALNGETGPRALPVCVTDVFLGTLLWINSPRDAREAHRKRLIADCYGAIAPDAALEARIVQQASRLLEAGRIGEDDHLLLTTSFVTKDLLAEKTLGDPDALDSQTSFDILENIKEGIRSDERTKLSEIELEKQREQRARERAEAERDSTSRAMEKAARDYGRRKAMIVSVLGGMGIGALLLLPVVGAVLVHWGWVAISGVGALGAGYLSYVRAFTLHSNYGRLVSKYSDEYLSRYFDDGKARK